MVTGTKKPFSPLCVPNYPNSTPTVPQPYPNPSILPLPNPILYFGTPCGRVKPSEMRCKYGGKHENKIMCELAQKTHLE